VLLALLAPGAAAQNTVRFSPDIHAALGTVSPALVADQDVALDDAAGSVALVPATEIAPLPPNADVTAYEPMSGGKSLLSFDASGAVGGIPFDDEDVLAFDTSTLSYSMHFDASLSDPADWPAADLVALPEPGDSLALLSGVALLAWLERARRRRPAP
jgi:hypothetical protein